MYTKSVAYFVQLCDVHTIANANRAINSFCFLFQIEYDTSNFKYVIAHVVITSDGLAILHESWITNKDT